MKRFIPLGLAAAMALTALGSTAASAQNYQGGPPGPPPGQGYNHPHPPPHGPGWGPGGPGGGPGWHQWHRGDHYYGSRYYVHNWHHYGLRPPPPGYQWVQNGGQFVLIAVTSGVIADIILSSR